MSDLPKKTKPLAIEVKDEIFKLLIEAVTDYAIFIMDKKGTILTWNKGAERLKGYSADEIIGKSFKLFYTPDNLISNHPEHELEVAANEGRYEEEGWRLRKDGRRFWANVIITKLFDEKNVFIGFSKITRDLTERKYAEEKLRESEERFRMLVSNVEDYAIITIDSEGYIQTWNIGAEKIKGFTAEEIIGRSFKLFYPKDDIESGKPDMELREARLHGRFEDEGWRVRKDGSRFWANVIITSLKNSSGIVTGFSKITRDLTTKRRAEETLKLTNASLEEKVASRTRELEEAIKVKDQFLSIASHELNTPLTTLKMQTQIRLKRTHKHDFILTTDDYRRSLNDDLRQVNRLVHLVDDMLEISRLNTDKLPLKKTEVELNELILEITKKFSPLFELAKNKIELDLTSEKIRGEWDHFRLEQVIGNLLTNASKYGSGKPIKITTGKEGDNAIIKIIDQGIGIDEKDQNRIFGQFERAISASEISGMGLGLYISKEIVGAHGGTINVESELDKGSTFTVELPL